MPDKAPTKPKPSKTIKFRSPTDKPLHVAITSGHAATIGPQWRELPKILHKAAIAEGAITSNMTQEAIDAAVEGASGALDQDVAVKNALVAMLEEQDEPDNFTDNGIPNIDVLSTRCGFNVERAQMLRVWKTLQEESGSEGDA
jgi:hypothetical protein